MNRYQTRAFEIEAGAGTSTANFEFDAVDFSNADELHAILHVETIGVDAGDTFDCYLQSRGPNGVWVDRIAFTQILGNASDDEILEAVLQKFGTFSDDEEESEPYGSAGASHLTAGTVRNGPFPGPYRAAAVGGVGSSNMPGAAWRLHISLTDADSDAFITGNLFLGADSAQ